MSILDYTTKECTKCKVEKHCTEFYTHKRNSSGLYSHCKECSRKGNKTAYALHGSKESRKDAGRRYHILKTYGITLEQYNDLLEKQGNCCALCGKHEDSFKQKLAVDHNHQTGQIRGLLCNYCNHRIVGRHRDGDLLRKVADYIEQGTEFYVPAKRPVKRKPRKAT